MKKYFTFENVFIIIGYCFLLYGVYQEAGLITAILLGVNAAYTVTLLKLENLSRQSQALQHKLNIVLKDSFKKNN